MGIDLKQFKIQDSLNKKIWDINGKKINIKKDVRTNLLKIANDFFKDLELDDVDILDIIFVGSLANYNWSKYSDVDLHIVIDYNEIKEIVDKEKQEEFFKLKKEEWENKHDIKIYGFSVEVFVQDKDHDFVSTAIYSLMDDKWISEPEKIEFDEENPLIIKKVKEIKNSLTDIKNSKISDKEKIEKLSKLKKKIKKMRKSGLDKDGEFSIENIVFKVLRRDDTISDLINTKNQLYDKMLTLEMIKINTLINFI
jgi:predicted nucleotidyltransferase